MIRTLATCHSKLALSLAGLLSLTPAASQAMEIRGIAKIGFDSGGDTLVNVPSLSSSTTQKIRANDGLVMAAGISVLNDARNFAAEATIGWKQTEQGGSIQDYKFTRYPLDVLGFYSFPIGETGKSQLRFGAGPTLHINTELVESGRLANNTTNFDNALGVVAQVDGVIAFQGGRWGINAGLRYTNVNYETSGIPAIRAKGIGIFIGGRFPVGF